MWRAYMLLTLHRPADAEHILRELLASEPQDLEAHRLLAMALLDRKQADAALEEARVAVALDPESDRSLYTLAFTHHRRGELPEAERAVRAAIALAPEDPQYATLLSAIELGRHRPNSALRTVSRGLALDPQSPLLAINKALALEALRKPQPARDALHEALALQPADALAFEALGFLEASTDRPREAVSAFREALRLDPLSATAREGLLLALKLRNPLYRMARGRYARFWVLGAFLAVAALANTAATRNAAPVVFVVFVICFGFADALMTLVLRRDPDARRAVSQREAIDSNRFAAAALLTIAAVLCAVFLGTAGLFYVALNCLFALFFIWASADRTGRTRAFVLSVAAILYWLTGPMGATVMPGTPEWLGAIGLVAFLIWLIVLFFGVLGFVMYDALIDLKVSTARVINKVIDTRAFFKRDD